MQTTPGSLASPSSAATFTLEPRGSFSLATLARFSCGLFTASRSCRSTTERVTLAFPSDDGFRPAGVELTFDGRRVLGRVHGHEATPALVRQVARFLTTDHDGRPFDALVAADPVLGRIAAAQPGFRPVVFYSPYVAAGWGVLSQRMRMSQTAALLRRIALETGDTVRIGDEVLAAFPRPQAILERDGFPGVPDVKWRRLQGVAMAALDGRLDADRLAAEPYDVARARLLDLPGVGPWTAELVLLRGVGPTDALPLAEPMLHRAVAAAYGLPGDPTDAEVARIAEAWRPFRMWTSILLVSHAFAAGLTRGLRPR